MITIKFLSSPELIEEASALLYEVYIEQQKWDFSPKNPSELRIETHNSRKLLVDRFTDRCIWFGAFDDEKLVGCIRLYGVDENNQLELETYPSSKPVLMHINQQEKHRYFEITKLAISKANVGRGIVERLLFACFKYSQENQYSLIGCTHNGYIKQLLKKIDYKLIIKDAFKYEPQDSSAVNFYLAEYNKSEVAEVLKKLEYLQSSFSNKTRTIITALENVEHILPTPFYWMDTNGVVLGINDLSLKAIGSTREIIGKKPYDFYKQETAEHILKHNAEVISKGEILTQEEWIEDITTKQLKCFSSVKAPLYDDEGIIIGIVGSSIEITSQKEADKLRVKNEQLEFENKTQKIIVEEQAKFKTAVNKMIHDIHTPLATLNILMGYNTAVPEKIRVLIKDSIMNVDNIAQNLLNQYTHGTNLLPDSDLEDEPAIRLMLVATLEQCLSEKKYQYENTPIQFTKNFPKESHLVAIEIKPSSFKRMLSNLINNAVDAIDKPDGEISISLEVIDNLAKIIIADNGKGMSSEVINMIINNIPVTQGKPDGHGIGLTQVMETVSNHHGSIEFTSKIGIGTQVAISFPTVTLPGWMADSIKLNPTDIVIVLDDDSGIHTAWDAHFEHLLDHYDQLQIEHFTQASEAISFVRALPQEKRPWVFLLCDYELINQNFNGMDVIAMLQPVRSILVTSHYANTQIQEQVMQQNIKLIPKQMIAEIPIFFNHEKDLSRESAHQD